MVLENKAQLISQNNNNKEYLCSLWHDFETEAAGVLALRIEQVSTIREDGVEHWTPSVVLLRNHTVVIHNFLLEHVHLY